MMRTSLFFTFLALFFIGLSSCDKKIEEKKEQAAIDHQLIKAAAIIDDAGEENGGGYAGGQTRLAHSQGPLGGLLSPDFPQGPIFASVERGWRILPAFLPKMICSGSAGLGCGACGGSKSTCS